MSAFSPRFGPRRPSVIFRAMVALSLLSPHLVRAAQDVSPAPGVDEKLSASEASCEQGDVAARAECLADLLAETPEQGASQGWRARWVESALTAFKQEFEREPRAEPLLAGIDVFQRYAHQHHETYGAGVAIDAEIVARVEVLRRLLKALDRPAPLCPEPPPLTTPDRRPQRLRIAGATMLTLSAGSLAILAIGAGMGRKYEAAVNESIYESQSTEHPVHLEGKAYNRMMIGGGVAAGVFLVAGIAVLATARHRASAGTRPRLGLNLDPNAIGATLSGRF